LPSVTVFRAFERGALRLVALSLDEVLRDCPEAGQPDWEVRSGLEDVPDARGTVIDWNKHGGSAFSLKVHWHCPRCAGSLHISDFDPAMPNPVLWLCESPSEGACLVHWEHEAEA
jgi:hypothetical protein